MARLENSGWTYSIGVRRQGAVRAAIEEIPESDWQPLRDYPDDGEAQIAQTMIGQQRLIVRRTRCVGRASRAVARLAALRFLDQPHRRARDGGGRASPARRRRARHPRPQRPGPGALPLRPLLRQAAWTVHRRARAQLAALDHCSDCSTDRPHRGAPCAAAASHPRTLARDARHDAADARPLALGPRLPRRAGAIRALAPPPERLGLSTTTSSYCTPASACRDQPQQAHRRPDRAPPRTADRPARSTTPATARAAVP